MTIAPERTVAALGVSHPMPDAEDRVVGTVQYTVDQRIEGMLHARLVTSTVPHAVIASIDTTEARSIEGVVAIITGDDILDSPLVPNPYFGLQKADQPPLAHRRVIYDGEPVVAVVARTESIARIAAAAVVVEYESLPYVTDANEALAVGAPQVHEDAPGNVCGEWRMERGNVDAAFATAAHVFEGTYVSPTASHVPFEPHVALASWTDDRLEIWSATQWPMPVRGELARIFDVAVDDVRVHALPLGGGFGAKSQLKIEPLVASLARLVGQPVRLALTREETFRTICKHAATVHIKTATDSDGRFIARDIDIVYNAGAYTVMSKTMVGVGLARSPGPYAVANLRARSRGAYTNLVPAGSFRGAMTNQIAFAYESQTDEIATALGIDPIELRRRNLLRDGDVYPSGQVLHDAHFVELIDDVAAHMDSGHSEPSPGWVRGRGFGVILKTMSSGPRTDVTLELHDTGRLVAMSSSVDMGQGMKGTLAQLAAHHVGVPVDLVDVVDPDTDITPFDSRTAASRTAYFTDQATRNAARLLRARIAELAGSASPDLVEALQLSGHQSVRCTGSYMTQPSAAFDDPDDVRGDITLHWHQGAVGVELDVEVETGRIRIVRCHGAAWAGRVINPTRVRLQSEGCIIFGIGPTLFEELVVDGGTIANPHFGGYMIPSILDVPAALTSSALESEDPDADVHGVGEMTIPAVAPAIANAVADATGIRLRSLPINPETILRKSLGAIEET